MRLGAALFLIVMTAGVAEAQNARNRREPHLGYVYPAGGRQGTSFHLLAGGQNLLNTSEAYVSGQGVHAKILHPLPPIQQLNRELARDILRRLAEVRENPKTVPSLKDISSLPSARKFLSQIARNAKKPANKATTRPGNPPELDVETLSLRELDYYGALIQNRDKRQPNAQIGQVVLIEITIDADAPQGDRELRLGSPAGLTNPIRFQVGHHPEIDEQEWIGPVISSMPELKPPFLINGQIMPGDVDRFRFEARQGQRLVMEVQARRLIPYLADAVPGWFQATLTLYDPEYREVAYIDDYRFSPDPVLLYEIPRDGEYQLEIRDALFRGREDFVYRLAVGESPFITRIFPLGGKAGTARASAIFGWNLPGERLRLDTKLWPEDIRQTSAHRGPWLSNEILYAIDSLPESREIEPNNAPDQLRTIRPPRIINGQISQPGDVDMFEFSGRAGDEIVAEVCARRLNSPLDSRLAILDAAGLVLETNDDCPATATGLFTHGADSYIRYRLPHTGDYFVQLTDTQQHGGEEYAYRLRISSPQPDFELRLTPSSINIPAGRVAPIRVHALRKDGFDGEIELALKDAPAGFSLAGARIPAGQDQIQLTLAAPRERPKEPVTLQLEGRARIGKQTVTRPVIPAEDMMQAFIYRHLVPSLELRVAVLNTPRPARGVGLSSSTPIKIPAGGTAEVNFTLPPISQTVELQPVLSEPPKGITLHKITKKSGGLTLVLKADHAAVQPGMANNIIVELFTEAERPRASKNAAWQKQRVSLGFLPAIPIEIVKR